MRQTNLHSYRSPAARWASLRAGRAVSIVLSILLLAIFAADPAFGQQAEVVYLEGFPEIYGAGGDQFIADFGDFVRPGESVVTGSTDYLELERGSQELIRVQPDTVFSMRQVQRGQEKETVLSTAAGAVSFRFDRITGREPMLGSPSVAAGVRGTEVTVYAGDDGTTLFLVTSGEVAVDSAGKETVLTAGQASEVLPGAEPSDAFEWKGRALDFSTWNDRRLAAFLDDPAVGVRRIRDQIAAFGDRIDELYPQYEETYQRLEEERDKNEQIVEEEGEEALQQHRDEVVGPLIQESQALILNVRYNAVSALSLKRFVLGKMYMNMKTRYIFDSENPTYREFLRVYREAVEDFENRIVPHLVPADI